ncbi:M23 family metallopeptidase [Pseudoflavitalea sp. X16]|uniref:M23 family metallopeptidase n=1 Tax=Paraflavitalea devenefica TaxID=2716334 RepID=UPI0014246CC9|nr:M23 family metallopeptidase [Paraflavitalea devenefica]NII27080.1 M23 family metallopeptidase [Paraflavitalea devenefica]
MKLKIGCLLLLATLFFQAMAQDLYTGVWRKGNGGTYLWSGVNWADFNKKWSDLGKQNLRLIDIETYVTGGQRYFSGVWEGGSDGYALTPAGLDWAAFNKFWSDASKTMRLIDIETYTEGSKRYFLGVFRQGGGGYALTPAGLDWAAFNTFWSNASKTMRLTDIETYTEGSKRYFLGVFEQGSGGYVLSPYGMNWGQFSDYWADRAKENLRLTDIESYEEGGKRIFLGVWRQGTDGYYLWHGVDWQSLTSKWAELNNNTDLRLIDLETFDGDCPGKCLNQALMADNPATSGRDSYDYGIYATSQHCEGEPGSCPANPSASSRVYYRWPNLKLGNDYYARNSVLFDAKDKIFTLPFNEKASDMSKNGWLYSPGAWHHALDYSKSGGKTFEIAAAATGKVIYVGYDEWSGNTIIISHDAGGKKDVYRTIYMHVRNGADNDCSVAWSKSQPTLNQAANDPTRVKYETHLKNTGCPLKVSDRNPDVGWWGTNAQKISSNLLGKTVQAGDVIGWAGSTGPGGSAANHLHIFFAHRDPGDKRWYFFDPYGIYATPDCYPQAVDGAINTPCARYPVAWKNGRPASAQ